MAEAATCNLLRLAAPSKDNQIIICSYCETMSTMVLMIVPFSVKTRVVEKSDVYFSVHYQYHQSSNKVVFPLTTLK